ncbi:MAG: hypothetical protein ACJ764_11470 [Solirubrobacteraceae bacterium]
MDRKGVYCGEVPACAGTLPLGARGATLGGGGATARRARLLLLAVPAVMSALSVGAASALAGPVGKDPSSNYRAQTLPSKCYSAPAGSACVNAGVYYLDQARGRLHQAPYKLPADFAKLSADRQVLILTNLDRIQYHLPPVPGLTAALNTVALGGAPGNPGVRGDGDPILGDPGVETTSNWAGGFPNVVLAYEAWMYDDGPGSGNLDCTSSNHTGCWGHRHDILWQFGAPGAFAMGVATGKDSRGVPGYAMLIAKGVSPATRAKPIYTWAQAKADGAGTHAYPVKRPGGGSGGTVKIVGASLHGRKLVVHIQAPRGERLKCTLSLRHGRHWSRVVSRRCNSVFRYSGIQSGHYRFKVTSARGSASETFTIS